jgi:hypothetical protein
MNLSGRIMKRKDFSQIGHPKNTWAHDVFGQEVNVYAVASGRKGYTCLGCKNDMEAVRFTDQDHASYFRHVPHDQAKTQFVCTYSDETYRHRVAKEILHRLKCIKVPAVWKYPPRGNTSPPALLERAAMVEASTVHNEFFFFEDEQGSVKWSN